MKKKSRKGSYVMLAVGLLFLGLLLGGIFYMKNQGSGKPDDSNTVEDQKKGAEKSSKEKETEKEIAEEQRKKPQRPAPEFQSFELLGSVFPAEQVEELKGRLTEKIVGSTMYESVTKVICKDTVIDLGDTIEFYCELNDEERTVFHIVFDKDEEQFSITKEKIPAEVLDQERKESENVSQQEAYEATKENEEKLPVPWEYTEPDQTPVSIDGMEVLTGKIPEEKLTELPQTLLQFFQEEEEYRREIQLEKETITENEKELCVWGIFQTPRLDKKELKICFDREAQSFQIALEER